MQGLRVSPDAGGLFFARSAAVRRLNRLEAMKRWAMFILLALAALALLYLYLEVHSLDEKTTPRVRPLAARAGGSTVESREAN